MSCDPVGVSDIAQRLGVKRETVAMWNYRAILPAPEWMISGQPAWQWSVVEAWAKETGRA